MPYLKGFLFQVKTTCTPEPTPSPCALPHQHQKRYSHCWRSGCVKTASLHIMSLPLRNGRTAERQRLWPALWLGLHLTPWVLPHLQILLDFLGPRPTHKNCILALGPTITKEQENPKPSLHPSEKPQLCHCPSLPAASPFTHPTRTLLPWSLLAAPGTEPRSPRCFSDQWQSSQRRSAPPRILYWQQRSFNLQKMVHLTGLTTSHVHTERQQIRQIVSLFLWVFFCKGSSFCCLSAPCQHIAHRFLYYKKSLLYQAGRKKVSQEANAYYCL